MNTLTPPTPMAIAYDLDETLAVVNMLRYGLEELGLDEHLFFTEVRARAQAVKGSMILSYLGLFLEKAKQAGIIVTQEKLFAVGKKFEPFPGIPEWFERINNYGLSKNVRIEHFVITCNLREIVAGTPIAPYLSRIYGSAFLYDDNGHAVWPAHAIDYTGKTQFLFRISKGCLEEYDDEGVNARMPNKDKEVPFSNMVYVGDGETDIPCMTVVREKGGYSFAVYNEKNSASKVTADQLAKDGRVHRALPANYSAGSRFDRAIKAVIDGLAAKAFISRM